DRFGDSREILVRKTIRIDPAQAQTDRVREINSDEDAGAVVLEDFPIGKLMRKRLLSALAPQPIARGALETNRCQDDERRHTEQRKWDQEDDGRHAPYSFPASLSSPPGFLDAGTASRGPSMYRRNSPFTGRASSRTLM